LTGNLLEGLGISALLIRSCRFREDDQRLLEEKTSSSRLFPREAGEFFKMEKWCDGIISNLGVFVNVYPKSMLELFAMREEAGKIRNSYLEVLCGGFNGSV
jgi:hypothetical protein